jgi:hypothetical protein
MGSIKARDYDKLLGIVFGVLTLAFLILAFTNESFFNWAYARHQNQLSWYIRPLFLLPFSYFAYKRSWAGIMATIFLMLTSMFWFPKPSIVGEQVKQFLDMEKQWLTGDWGASKILMALLVPISLIALGMALWKRSLLLGISVIVLIAVGKMVWSVLFAGEAGKSIFIPAILGLGICVGLVYFGFRRLERKNKR